MFLSVRVFACQFAIFIDVFCYCTHDTGHNIGFAKDLTVVTSIYSAKEQDKTDSSQIKLNRVDKSSSKCRYMAKLMRNNNVYWKY